MTAVTQLPNYFLSLIQILEDIHLINEEKANDNNSFESFQNKFSLIRYSV